MSTETMNELVHAVANISHVERPYLENLLAVKKLEIAKEPVDKVHDENTSKVSMWQYEHDVLDQWSLQWIAAKFTCRLQSEKDRTLAGLKKAQELAAESEKDVQVEKDKIHDIEIKNEKHAIDYRNLQKYREELTVLLDSALTGEYPSVTVLKDEIEEFKNQSTQKFDKIKTLEHVRELIKGADRSLLEAILELRSSTMKETLVGSGKVYFPQEAYDALKQAREEYPELPGFASPTEYTNEADNTGAYYSPMQKYLWDVRTRLAELIAWCSEQDLKLLDEETEIQINLGAKIDEYNFERRRIIKEGLN